MVQEALDQLGLDRVVLMPVAVPPHKEAPEDPGADVRLDLCRLAVARAGGVGASALEIARGGASYTVDTLRALHERAPEHALTFIVGGDMADSLPSWREPEAVLDLARLAVAERDGLRREDIAQRLAPLHSGDRVAFFDMPRIDLSSSAVRARVAAGRPIPYLVPHPGGGGRRGGRRGAPHPVPRPGPGGRGDPVPPSVPSSRWEACRMTLSPERLATTVAAYAADKKASDITVLDLREVAGYTDFFVVVSGTSDRQAKAIHDGIHQGLKKHEGLLPRRVEGVREARWILMDYLDVVVHVFTPETRDYYRLEALWGDVRRRDLDPVELLAELPETAPAVG